MRSFFYVMMISFLTACSLLAQEKSATKRFTNQTELGGLFGRVKYGNSPNSGPEAVENKLSLSFQTFNGLRLTDRLSAGGTVGIDWYRTALINPISVGARFDLTTGFLARLYVAADAGYGFAWFNEDTQGFETKGGLMLNPGFGMKYGKPGGPAFTIGLGYKRQNVTVSKPPLWQQTERFEERVYNRLAIRIGMVL